MPPTQEVIIILADVLNLGERRDVLHADSPLLGSIPELDSMAVINVLTALEDHFGISIDDADISAATFSTVATLAAYVDRKRNE